LEGITNQTNIKKVLIPKTEYGKRIDTVLSFLIPSLTRVQIKKLFEDKKITINGKHDKPSKSVKGGETVTVEIPPPTVLDIKPENIEIEYIYEDKDIIVINKPAGISVHPAAGINHGTLVNALLYKTKDLSGIGGKIRPGIVHRLDKDTTGIMIVAKNDLSHINLSEQFKNKTIHKKYLAFILGNPKQGMGTISLPLGRHRRDRKKISSQSDKPRVSETKWKVINRYTNIAYVEVEPLTGRTHQIRVHLSEYGYPIVGDKMYGRKKYPDTLTSNISKLFNRQALHAFSLSFNHPRSNVLMKFEAPLPKDFSKALALLDKNG
jgi:23S rRNA pseudouridine1911/1915/1917 synthase